MSLCRTVGNRVLSWHGAPFCARAHKYPCWCSSPAFDISGNALKPPIGFNQIWNDRVSAEAGFTDSRESRSLASSVKISRFIGWFFLQRSGCDWSGAVWQMECPPGVACSPAHHSTLPGLSAIQCRYDLSLQPGPLIKRQLKRAHWIFTVRDAPPLCCRICIARRRLDRAQVRQGLE